MVKKLSKQQRVVIVNMLESIGDDNNYSITSDRGATIGGVINIDNTAMGFEFTGDNDE